MSVSEFCIRHPVATTLMSAALIIGGLFAFVQLPVAALPQTDFPVIDVSASLSGASPDTMANAVATPLIKQFATISGISSITATSSLGATSVSVEFNLDRDIDAAAADVQAAIARVQRQLPEEMVEPPSYRKINPADSSIAWLALQSDTLPLSKLDEMAQQMLSPSIATIDGVAQLRVFGSQKFAVRIQVDPNALAMRGIGVGQVEDAVAAANSSTPVGTLQNNNQSVTIDADTELFKADEFGEVIIANPNGRPVRLKDVANVIDSVENNQTASWVNGDRGILLGVYRQPGANTVDVVDRVKAALPQLQAQLPPAAKVSLLLDRSTSVRAAVEDVEYTLILTIALVILVILIFLRKLSATFIAGLAVPISIIATLGAMHLFGFSLNNISLLGLTLSVGLVVDDAIVMLENIYRHMEEGKTRYEAAIAGAREISFTIISITVSLVAVFIPVLLMGGVVGRVFNEFAVVVTCALLASAFVSLTLTPMLCARMLTAPTAHRESEGWKAGWFERGFDKMHAGYDWLLQASLRHRATVLMIFVMSVAATAFLFYIIPKGFFPTQDIGQLRVSTEARQDISLQDMARLQAKVEQVFEKSPYVTDLLSIVGSTGGSSDSTLNRGRLFVQLVPKSERPPLDTMLEAFRKELAQVPGIDTFMRPEQDLRFGTRSSKSQFQFVMQGLDQEKLYDWSERMKTAMGSDPMFVDVTTDLQNHALQSEVVVDKDKAQHLGITADQLRATLYSGFGTRQISTIYSTGDSYAVIMEFDPRFAWTNNLLDGIHLRASNGRVIPLSAVAEVRRGSGTLSVNQLGQLPAVTVSFNLPNGVALGEATKRIERLKAEIRLPADISTTFSGEADIFQQSLGNQNLLIFAAVLTIYIVLGILYESFIHPLTILTGLPAAAFGALGSLMIFGMDLSVIAVIGVLMLIGIVKKNAIMMIDVALDLQRQGMPSEEAIYRACLMRFRPIMMTTFAALVGALPIAVGLGHGAELRQPLGVAVVGGLLVSQALTLFITPVIYLYMDRLAGALGGRGIETPTPTDELRA
ncbi:Multidrug resistance protein MdtB [Methyloligella halotolerans]|uniref:Multidrug resistance protein MdtB n=1 Tax=Methyloligella halotolerans TaxID=1177755 RepID=A0A1E2RV17_9HYPH|nr:efflux RND transporter permease subunit [Methyloligella halotolerans]ODA66051.1 Multidrug resistance protein MdtB [Methyloligella halotolerans]